MIRLMTRAAAVAVGVFAVVGSAAAVDPAQKLGRYRPDDDKKVAAPAPSPLADDTEQVRHRYGWGGYRPYYGGGYRSYYGGGFYGRPSYYGGYYGYRPSFYGSYYGYRPSFYGGGFSYGYSSFYTPRYYYSPSYYYGGFCGIGGDLGSLVTLGLSLRPTVEREFDAAPRALPSPLAPGTFRYDGGPNTVVPQPTPDGRPMPKAEPAPAVPDAVEALKISVKKPAAVKPTPRYKAYGEK